MEQHVYYSGTGMKATKTKPCVECGGKGWVADSEFSRVPWPHLCLYRGCDRGRVRDDDDSEAKTMRQYTP